MKSFQRKEKMRVRARLWWTCVKANKEVANNGLVEMWSKYKEFLFIYFYRVTI
jgi:hypothetical protein